MAKIPDEVLDEMVQVIVDAIDPEKIILFGSQATGNPDENSDVDILIIDSKPFGKDRSRRKLLGQLWRSLARFRFSLDLLLYTIEEAEKWMNSGFHIIGTAFNKGRVIYERG